MVVGWQDETHRFEITKDILGTRAVIGFSIKQNFYVEADFDWVGSTCSFIITRWMNNNGNESFRLFLKHYTDTKEQFGFIDEEDAIKCSTQQKRNIIEKSCNDVICALKLIIEEHKKSLLDYAVWYRDKRPGGKKRSNYSEFITTIACDCIIHGGILAFDKWSLVEYP